MAESEEKFSDVTIHGTTYEALADGDYDAILLGTGLKECILSGLLGSEKKMKVLHIDRNSYYGADGASLMLDQLFDKFRGSGKVDMKEAQARLGRRQKYCVDLIPKFLMADGKLVKILNLWFMVQA